MLAARKSICKLGNPTLRKAVQVKRNRFQRVNDDGSIPVLPIHIPLWLGFQLQFLQASCLNRFVHPVVTFQFLNPNLTPLHNCLLPTFKKQHILIEYEAAVPLEIVARKCQSSRNPVVDFLKPNLMRRKAVSLSFIEYEFFHGPVITSLWTERQFVRHQNQ